MIVTQKQYTFLIAALLGIVFFVSCESAPVKVEAQTTTPIKIIKEVETETTKQDSKGEYQYVEITQSCGPDFEGRCIPVYSGPGTEYEKVSDLRTGMILKIKSIEGKGGQIWYQVYFDEWLRHPERVVGEWYIPAVAGRVVNADGEQMLSSKSITNKRIMIDLSDHMIYAYDGNREFLQTKVSTGVELSPTPVGTFTVYKKTPSRYMQGPIPGVSDNPFDLPGVPWNLYFTEDGAVIHGSYWHDRYGTAQSSGCVNLPPELAKLLYDWADLGTSVTIQN